MKTSKLAIVVSILVGGVIGAATMHYSGPAVAATASVSSERFDFRTENRGELTQSSPVNLKDGSRYQAFRLNPQRTGILSLRQSGALQGQLILLNDQFEVIQQGTDRTLAAFIDERLSNQSLLLVVSGQDASSYGPFRLESEWVEVGNTDQLISGEEITGYLQGQPTRYSLQIDEQGIYQFDMKSDQFDSYLRLEGNSLNQTDDDSGDGLNARLNVFLQPGSYQLSATTPFSDGSDTYGLYTIQMRLLESADNLVSGGNVEIGQSVRGMLQSSSARFNLHVPDGRRVRVSAESDNFDTVLEIEGPTSFYDDDGGSGTNSLVNDYFPAGHYTIIVRPFSSGTGVFQLSVH